MQVLVVEDDALIRMMIQEFLEGLGATVVASAGRLDEGLSKASTVAVDVAILDINLDGQLSYPIALRLRDRGIPFLFATGYGTARMPQAFQESPVLAKPFGIEELEVGLLRATTASSR